MTDGPARPVPAATVALLRPDGAGEDAEVLLTRRPATMAFAANLDVFPGGRVDPADGDGRFEALSVRTADDAAAVLGHNVPPGEALALHAAAIRELIEEVGVCLSTEPVEPTRLAAARQRLLAGRPITEAFDDGGPVVRFATDELVPVAQWTTPAFMSRRFATWFFAADLPRDAELTVEADEVVEARWVRPIDALDGLEAGTSSMWVPTSSVLQQLAAIAPLGAGDVQDAIRFAPVEPPRLEDSLPDGVRIVVCAAGAVLGRPGSVALIGRSASVVVDPGDPSEAAIDAILAAAAERDSRIAAIVLTGSDPERAAGAEALALPLGVPILVAPGAGRHLPYDAVEVRDGELLPTDMPLRVRLGPPGSGRLRVDLTWRAPG